LKESDPPTDEAERTRTILSIFGSPDRRQIDGLGGADPLTSKLAIIGPARTNEPRAAGTHLTYTFGQVEIAYPEIDWLSLCGNISSAVGGHGAHRSSRWRDRDRNPGREQRGRRICRSTGDAGAHRASHHGRLCLRPGRVAASAGLTHFAH